MDLESLLEGAIDPYMMGVLLSLAIGLILGLEREYDKRKGEFSIAGLRTFPIATILGFSIGFLSEIHGSAFLLVGMLGFMIFLGLGQLSKVVGELRFGLTTNLALVSTFVLGVMVSDGLYRDSVATAVIIVTLLSLRTTFKSIVESITLEELFAFVKFVIIALLIVPFLPNEAYGDEKILNPFEIGAIVVIVSLLNFVGYFLVKFVGSKKGILLTSILGGIISSTAVAWNYAAKSKKTPELSSEYSAGIIIASSIMFPRLLILAAIFSTAVAWKLFFPMLILTVVSVVPAIWFVRQKSNHDGGTEIALGNPLNVLSALWFALIYTLILYAVHYGNIYFGESGLYMTSVIAGLADTTAITISMAKFGLEEAQVALSALVILAATLSNTLVKLGIVMAKANRRTGRLVGSVFGATTALGLVYIFMAA